MQSGNQDGKRMVIGWREWVSLQALGLPWVKTKVDTGAKTSSLHAFQIKAFTERGKKRVRFRIHPLSGRSDIEIVCVADVVDYREVSDSGGHREKRYVIKVPVRIGDLEFPIEVTLANRQTMSFRMLLGRSAMERFLIDPTKSFLLGRPKSPSRAYGKAPRKKA